MEKDEKPFDSQFLSRIFHSDTTAEGKGGKRGEGDQGVGGVCVWGRRVGGFRRDQSSPVFHVGGSERLPSAKLDKKRGAH